MSTKDILSDPKQLIPFLNRKLYEKECHNSFKKNNVLI